MNVSSPHTTLILRTIREHANEQGCAWWTAVGPVLEPFGLEFDHVVALKAAGLIERGGEMGALRLTPAGVKRAGVG